VIVGHFEFLEWTAGNHLRHSQFVGLREDKKAKEVVRE
jgi:bifunctional non-homologous end joining protein LigD